MAIVIKEIQVKMTVAHSGDKAEITEECIRKIKQEVLNEINYLQQKKQPVNRKER